MADDRFKTIDALLAEREDELALRRARADGGGVMQVLRRYRERAEVAEARLRIAEEDLARSRDAHGRDAVRAAQAEAALTHARLLAGDMLYEAFCAGHPKTPEWRAAYRAAFGEHAAGEPGESG